MADNYNDYHNNSSDSDNASDSDDSAVSVDEYQFFMYGGEIIRSCDVVDVLLAQDMSHSYLRLFEVPTDHDGGWYWLAAELAYMYLVLNNLPEGTHPVSRMRLTPYNCWPGRSVSYWDTNNMLLTWPTHLWEELRTSLSEIQLLGGIE